MSLFDAIAALVRGLVPAELGEFRERHHNYGIKVWFGPVRPPREHYEAQVIGAKYVDAAKILALEVGFHAEHAKVDDNEAVITRLLSKERRWRKIIGKEAEVGPFLGADVWRRVSETWVDPDLGDPDLAMEVAVRLVDYVTALEPVRRA